MIVVPQTESNIRGVERVAVGGFLGDDEVDVRNFANMIVEELHGNEIFCRGLAIRVTAFSERKRTRVHVRKAEGHGLVDLGSHDCWLNV